MQSLPTGQASANGRLQMKLETDNVEIIPPSSTEKKSSIIKIVIVNDALSSRGHKYTAGSIMGTSVVVNSPSIKSTI